jgi:hypothetical protein
MPMCPRCRYNHPMHCFLVKKRIRFVKEDVHLVGIKDIRYLAFLQDHMDKLRGAVDAPIRDERKAAAYIAYHNMWCEYARIRFKIEITPKSPTGRDYARMIELIDKVRNWRLSKELIRYI